MTLRCTFVAVRSSSAMSRTAVPAEEATMQYPDDQLTELGLLCAAIQRFEEAGLIYFLLSKLNLPNGCRPSPIDALLCPNPRDSPASRLYFAERVTTSAPLNWAAN